jgi:hypothetical protein
MDAARMREFATSVSSFFAANGSLKINNGSPSGDEQAHNSLNLQDVIRDAPLLAAWRRASACSRATTLSVGVDRFPLF